MIDASAAVGGALVRRERTGSLRAHAELYRAFIRMMILRTMQYRVNNAVEMTLMLAEPVVYLLVWRAVADAQGGSVDGFTPARFAAYFIAWSLVRVCTQVGSPSNWERFIKDGRMNGLLLRPMHPAHQDVAMWIGFGLARLAMWLPAGVVLTLLFRPALSTSVLQVIVFIPALLLANVLGSVISTLVGTTAFWLDRVGGLSMTVSLLSLVLSGRIVPLELMPGWVQAVSWAAPFRWTFAYPIETLIGPISVLGLVVGLAMQVGWLLALIGALRVYWGRGVTRYGAVGG